MCAHVWIGLVRYEEGRREGGEEGGREEGRKGGKEGVLGLRSGVTPDARRLVGSVFGCNSYVKVVGKYYAVKGMGGGPVGISCTSGWMAGLV